MAGPATNVATIGAIQGAFGRRRDLNSGFNIAEAFPQGLEHFSMNTNQTGEAAGYYYIAVCIGYECALSNL